MMRGRHRQIAPKSHRLTPFLKMDLRWRFWQWCIEFRNSRSNARAEDAHAHGVWPGQRWQSHPGPCLDPYAHAYMNNCRSKSRWFHVIVIWLLWSKRVQAQKKVLCKCTNLYPSSQPVRVFCQASRLTDLFMCTETFCRYCDVFVLFYSLLELKWKYKSFMVIKSKVSNAETQNCQV